MIYVRDLANHILLMMTILIYVIYGSLQNYLPYTLQFNLISEG